MSDHNETPSTEDEIEDVISEAKKAAKAQNPNKSGKSKKNRNRNRNKNKTKAQDEESSENLFNEIDSVADAEDDDENLSPKQKSAKDFSKAFVAAKEKREKNLNSKRASEEVSDDEDDEEDVVFDTDDDEEFDDSEEFEVDSEDEEYDEDGEEDDEEYDGIFETDDENEEYIENVDVDDDDDEDFEDDDEDEEDEDDYDEDDDEDDDESTFSTKAKVIIGIIIAILVLAIIGAGLFFLNRSDSEPKAENTVSQASDGSVTGIQFKEPSVSIRVGETIPLEIVVEPEDAADKVLRLKSNDATIAKVDETGNLTGVSSGSTTVTATLKSNETITASLIVNVIDDDQDAINIYNKFVNSIVDGSTDIDPDTETDTDTDEQQYDENGNPIESSDTDSDSDSDSDTQKTVVAKDVLTGNIIKDLDSDGELELALLYKGEQDSSKVRFFRLADPNEEEEEEDEPQYDENGNLIETEDTDSEAETDAEKKDETAPSDKVLTEVEEFTELYTTYYSTIETEGASWNTSYIEIKEEESEQAKVTILSSGYESPSYTYESEDQTIATVDNQGNIKAIKPGTTYVTVSSPLNSDAVAKIKVRVKDDTDLLDDYLAQIPTVNSTNDSIFPTETLTGKAIVDIDNDGVSELLLRFDYGSNVEAIEMIKVENEKCVAYKTYNNLSDLYEYSEGNGSYSNSILVHYTTGKVCMQYKAVVAKEDSKTRTTEQKILSVESGGGLSELVNFKTTTDITTKTVTSEVVVEEEEDNTTYYDNTSSEEDTDSETTWYDDEDTDSDDEYYSTASDDEEDNDDDYSVWGSYAQFTFDDIVDAENNGINLNAKKAEKKLPEAAAAPDDDDEDGDEDDDNTSSADSSSNDDDDDDEQSSSRVTSTVTSEVSEETTKYFVNGTPVEQSVYEETLSTYAARYSVWNAWESVNS